jgi:hypothetical protein
MCIGNSLPPSDPEPTLYCRTEGRIVDADYAAIVCWTSGHDVDQSTDESAA